MDPYYEKLITGPTDTLITGMEEENMPKKKKVMIKKGLLDKKQKTFIEKKVKELKTIKAVEAFYNRDDAVTKYARKVATKMYISKRKVKVK